MCAHRVCHHTSVYRPPDPFLHLQIRGLFLKIADFVRSIEMRPDKGLIVTVSDTNNIGRYL